MTFIIEEMVYPSGAEAVAYYFKQGFVTSEKRSTESNRVMVNSRGDAVTITHVGFLRWRAVVHLTDTESD